MEKRQASMIEYVRGCTGFDSEARLMWHAEDVGWPLKKSDRQSNVNKIQKVDFSPMAEQLAA